MLFLIVLSSLADAQLRDPATSPVFNADRTVTFRLRAPEADNVKLNAQFLDEPTPMKKNADGVWELTVGPAEPKVYYYSFLVDGVSVMDPQNPAIATSLLPSASTINYPGDGPQFYDEQDVPHGVVHTHHYHSKLENASRRLNVYTPPGYDPAKKYPVLYLFHGYSDNDRGWIDLGRANFILDNLIDEKKAVPMIIVMPFGYSEPRPGDNGDDWGDWALNVVPRYERDIMNEIIPLVEGAYSTAKGRENRAVAGLSMGGGQSLYVGLKNLDSFAWVGAFSAAANPKLHGPLLATSSAKINASLKLFWIAIGEDDFLLQANKEFTGDLKAKGIKHEFYLTEGPHTWWVWHRYLRDFSQRLFK